MKTSPESDPFDALITQAMEAELHWINWKALFFDDAKPPEGADTKHSLLNWSTPAFFGIVQKVLFHDIVLQLCRMSDPSRDRNRENLSFENLIEKADWLLPEERSEARQLIESYKTKIKPLISWRHRRIAHNDYRTATMIEPIQDFPYALVDELVSMAQRTARAIERNKGRHIHPEIIALGQAPSLISLIRGARRASLRRIMECQSPLDEN